MAKRLKKFVVHITAVKYQKRYLKAESAAEARAIVDGESEIDLNDAEYDYDEDDGPEEITTVREIKRKG